MRQRPDLILITAEDAFIGQQLRATSELDPCAARIEAISVDHVPIADHAKVPNILSSGAEEIYRIAPGFCLHFADGVIGRHWKLTAWSDENCLRMRIPFFGEAHHGTSDVRISDLGSRCTFLIQPAGTSLTGLYREGAAYRFCALHLSQTYLERQLGVPAAEWPRLLASSWQLRETAFGHFDLDRGALNTAGRLFSLASRGAWRQAEVKAIALDLLHQLFEAWLQEKGPLGTRIRFRPSERDQLHRLRTIAQERSPHPISMIEAVELTGLNKNKIHIGFRRVFGMSLHDYCFDLRMQLARRLLSESSMSIAAISERTGFSEPTNFTAAFRRYFSILPSDARCMSNGT